jgi:hypothetical protein
MGEVCIYIMLACEDEYRRHVRLHYKLGCLMLHQFDLW